MNRLVAVLLAATGVVHLALGTTALTGADRLEANVREIMASPSGGDPYLSLTAWGAIFTLSAIGQLGSAGMLAGGRRRSRMAGLVACFLAMGVVFLSLPIFRLPAVATLPLLFAVAYLAAYHIPDEA